MFCPHSPFLSNSSSHICILVFLFSSFIPRMALVVILIHSNGEWQAQSVHLIWIPSMIEGNLMLRPLSLLASLISVPFIGLGCLPKHWSFPCASAEGSFGITVAQ